MTTTTPRRRFRRLALGALVLTLTAAACGGDDEDAGDTTEAPAASAAPAGTESAGTESASTTPADTESFDTESVDTESADTDSADTEASPPGSSAPVGTEADGTEPAGTDAAGTAPTGEGLRVAVVAPSTINDLAWTQALADGLSALEESEGLEIAYSENMFVVEDAGAALRDYASQGYDLVIAHGTQYAGSIETLAPEFPDVSFAYGTATDTFDLPNVFAYTSAAEEGGYVNGIMAAAIADGEPIGVVGPLEAGDAKLYVDGFIEGAEAGGSTNTTATYTGSFSDVALAAEAANAFVASGATVLSGTSQSVVGAVGVATENDIPFFATQSNGTQLSPDLIVASHVYKFDVILALMFEEIRQGVLGGESFELDYANGGFALEFNDGYDLDPEIRTLGEDTVEAIVAGEIDPGA